MAIPDYADTLLPTSPLVDSWRIDEPYRAPLKTDMEGGNVRYRTRPGDEKAQISFGLLFSAAQYATFKTFAATTLGRGASRFTMLVWNGSAMVEKTVQLVDGIFDTTSVYPKMRVDLKLHVYGGL
jgi:hypothetical protein